MFPVEIWYFIAEYGAHRELLMLSLSCKGMQEICSRRLQEEKEVREEHRVWNYNDVQWGAFPIHKLLLRILKGELSPSYIVELKGLRGIDITEVPKEVGPLRYALTHIDEPENAGRNAERFRRAIESSRWIRRDQVDKCYRELIYGNEDAALAILIPLLTNLRSFCAPTNAFLLPVVVGKIAKKTVKHLEECRRNRAEGAITAEKMLTFPLEKLVVVVSGRSSPRADGTCGIPLVCLALYAALPSVRRLAVDSVNFETFERWPTRAPHSQVREIYFFKSKVSDWQVRKFAKGLDGPCIFRQDIVTPHSEYDTVRYPNWDKYTIDGRTDPATGRIIAGTRVEKMELCHNGRFHRENHARIVHGPRPWRSASTGFRAIFDGRAGRWEDLVS